MGTGAVGGSDVGFLVDISCHRAVDLPFFVIVVVRVIGGGGRFMCIGPHDHDTEETARLRREIEELREQIRKQQAAK